MAVGKFTFIITLIATTRVSQLDSSVRIHSNSSTTINAISIRSNSVDNRGIDDSNTVPSNFGIQVN